MDPTPAPPPPAPPPAPPPPRRRLALPLTLGGALLLGNLYFFERDRGAERHLARVLDERNEARARVQTVEEALLRARAEGDAARRAVEERGADLERVQGASAAEAARLQAEREAAARRAAELADRLGEERAARERAEKRAAELDALLGRLAERKVNVRRLAGLEVPPRVELDVVQVDERRVPPVLVLRASGSSEGLEEGDRLWLVRSGRETGQALVERVDHAKGLLSARISRLDPGERVVVGDVLRSYGP